MSFRITESIHLIDFFSFIILEKLTALIIQLMVGIVITETGQNVQLIVGEEHKPEPGLVQTQLQLMVVQIVLGRQQKLRTATLNLVQVNIA